MFPSVPPAADDMPHYVLRAACGSSTLLRLFPCICFATRFHAWITFLALETTAPPDLPRPCAPSLQLMCYPLLSPMHLAARGNKCGICRALLSAGALPLQRPLSYVQAAGIAPRMLQVTSDTCCSGCRYRWVQVTLLGTGDI